MPSKSKTARVVVFGPDNRGTLSITRRWGAARPYGRVMLVLTLDSSMNLRWCNTARVFVYELVAGTGMNGTMASIGSTGSRLVAGTGTTGGGYRGYRGYRGYGRH